MTLHIQNAPFTRDVVLGQSSSTNVTVTRGGPAYVGTDADGNTNRLIPVTDASAHEPNGISLIATADVDGQNVGKIALWPMTIMTDDVDGTNPPEAVAGNRVFLLDTGLWSDADGSGVSASFGTCIEVKASGTYSGFYVLQLTGPDFDT
jgi:hypothetical protein